MEQIKSGSESVNCKDAVRGRLLDVAESLFCEKGFEGVSVRELTAAAGCNLAAVNYYFGGKDKLYAEMFRRQFAAMVNGHMETFRRISADADATLEGLFRAIIEPAIRRVSENEQGGKVMKLLIREIMSKRIDAESMCEDMKSKFFDELGRAILRFVPDIPENKILMITYSIDGVVLHPFLFMDFYDKMMPGFDVEELIDHMVRFVTAAIYGYTSPTKREAG
ncbi:MAG: TetR family transcriptional regulator [Planctomycetota bacterium]|jgi:AcrR family transcriptional regulator